MRAGFGTLSWGRISHWLRWIPTLVLLLPWLFGQTQPSVDSRIRQLTGPWSFQALDWITASLVGRSERLWSGLTVPHIVEPDLDAIARYFATPPAARADLRQYAEAQLERLVGSSLQSNGVGHAVPGWERRVFPPVLAAFTAPPNMLIVSPRDDLRVMHSVMLQPSLPAHVRDRLERSVESHGVSSLVTPIGGLATYPAMVLEANSVSAALDSITHEWTHQYLIFYPLGQAYWSSGETRTINETVADLVGQEIADHALKQLGVESQPPVSKPTAPPESPGQKFDYRAYMRETRLEVEEMLAAGAIAEAEEYMEQRRLGLEAHGYFIRRLNQAYFAFYGSYGEGFAASPRSPIPQLVREVRARSESLGEFLARVRNVRTLEDLRAAAS